MKGTLYFDCSSGISGDMAVAAMLDLGVDPDELREAVESIPTHGFSIDITRIHKSGAEVCDFDVVLEIDNRDHDMEYLYGEEEPAAETHHHRHHHRGLKEIVELISGTAMRGSAKELAIRMFTILAEAEAEAHGTTPDQVHFHEVGALDSIVDVIALAFCVDSLAPERICFSELYEGTGWVRCQHGRIPVPVPATAAIVRRFGLPMHISESRGEYVTPTGAAFVAAVRNSDVPDDMVPIKVGRGNGKRVTDRPGYVTAMLLDI